MKTVSVWDPFVRLFHWALVAGVIVQLITAETSQAIHVPVGYALFLLLLARVIWGLIGSRHARFVDFVYPPGVILGYLKGLVTRTPKHYLGHNPAGGAMVCLLLLVMLLTTTTGLKAHNALGRGPMARVFTGSVTLAQANGDEDHNDDDDSRDGWQRRDFSSAEAHFWKEIHEGLVALLILLVVIHIGGVIVSSILHKENLILAMINGKKPLRE